MKGKWWILGIVLMVTAVALYFGLRKPGAGTEVAGGKHITLNIMSWQGQNPSVWDAYEQVIKKYEAKHPNVKVEHIYQPIWGGGYDKLLNTQFIAGKGPDAAMMFAGWAANFTNQGFLLPLDGYYREPTPYSEGKRWIDTLTGGEAAFTRVRTANRYGAISLIPQSGFGNPMLPFYYNKEILKQAGATGEPKTWMEFIEVCKKIKAAGYVPVAADNGRWIQWICSMIGNQLGPNYYDQFFSEKYHDPKLGGDAGVIAKALGKVNADAPVVADGLRIIKEFARYWQEGWTGANEQEAQQLFMFGKAAFLMDGNWNWGYYKANVRGFEWGILPFPLITKASTPYAAEAFPKGPNQYGEGWAINKQVAKNPAKLQALLDFFQYFTSKEAQTSFTKMTMFVPVNKEIKGTGDIVKFMATPLNRLEKSLGSLQYDGEPAFTGLFHQYLTGTMPEAQFKKDYNALLLKVSRKLVKDALDPQIGFAVNIKATAEEFRKAEADKNRKPAVMKALRDNLALMRLRLSMYQEYGKGL